MSNQSLTPQQEWLVTNGIGGYACGTVTGRLTRCYHGLLIAALKPPLQRTLLLTKLDEIAIYNNTVHPLYENCWSDGIIEGRSDKILTSFQQEGMIPVWSFTVGDAILEKRIWMQHQANTTYIYYSLIKAEKPLKLSLKALVNYRDHHSRTHNQSWKMQINIVNYGVCIQAFNNAVPFYLLSDRFQRACGHYASFTIDHIWHHNFQLEREKERGLDEFDNNLHAATFEVILQAGESVTFVVSSDISNINSHLNGEQQLTKRRLYEKEIKQRGLNQLQNQKNELLELREKLILAADQFIVNRPLPNHPEGKTIIAGYPWFTDWGRDTMISLPGLTLTTGRPEIARSILLTFAEYVSKGMLPNQFPDDGTSLNDDNYNTVDATLWYFEAIRAYYQITKDQETLTTLYPILKDIISWHCRGTRYNIHLDQDSLIYAGVTGKQLTWMDAKVGNWVVTPRIGKPVEINALWYNALIIMSQFAADLGDNNTPYQHQAEQTLIGFQQFWNAELGYCFDVLDTPDGNDAALRPNQIFAVSLPASPLTYLQQKAVVDSCQMALLTPYGLRSLAPNHPLYQGDYGGTQLRRDAAYHQGTVWSWLLGPFAIAHLRVYQNTEQVYRFFAPMNDHLQIAGLGTISEIFAGDAPFSPQGCIAQAWSVAEILKAISVISSTQEIREVEF